MNSKNNQYQMRKSTDNATSYEEQLLQNYDAYLQGTLSSSISTKRHFIPINDDLDQDLEEDFEAEYDENDWEEETIEPETFSDDGFKVD